MATRSSNAAWEKYMSDVVLNVTREFRDFFADRGGPIILGQVENELHTLDRDYVDWCGELAVKTGIPIAWGMCNGNSSTKTINTCNGGDCTSFIERNGQNQRVLISEPALWTENWMGWFDAWGGKAPAGDWPTFESTEQSASKAFGILRWTARGGSHVNFYNWAGGNHFARNAGSSMVNVYYWKAPIAPDNLAQGPERKHMSRVYAAIAQVSDCILSTDAQLHKQKMLPGNAMAFVYSCGDSEVVFLENGCEGGGSCPASVAWQGKNHSVPAGSATILEDGEAIFNSADVKPLGKKHVWTATSSAPLEWKAWADLAIPKSAKELPPPSPPYTLNTTELVGMCTKST